MKGLWQGMVESFLRAIGAPGWDEAMAHVDPREWHPRHKLDRVLVDAQWCEDGSVQLIVTGRSSTQRADLWRHSEMVGPDEHPLTVSDIAHHMLVVALQDRPRSSEQFQRGLVGEGWEDVPLPF